MPMNARLGSLLFAVGACCSSLLHAASFDCAKAQRPLEKAICSDPKLSVADTNMAAAYRADLARLSSGQIGLLRADQVQWLDWMQQVCHVDDPAAKPAACVGRVYAVRIKQLRRAVVRRGGLTFLTRTQYLATTAHEPPAFGADEYAGFGTLQASWPVADSAEDAWLAWNKAVEARTLRLAADGQEISGEQENAAPNTAWDDRLADSTDLVVTANLRLVEQDRATTTVSVEGMGHGAAHPFEEYETMTWLLELKRSLRADDVFRADSAWRNTVAAECWRQMSTGEKASYIYSQVKGPDAKALQEVILNTSNWTLKADGLHISYPEYTVAPRYVHMDDAVISWAMLKGVMKVEFVLPSE